ncbi:MAG: gliding motility-associated C-terminal domain-containing protein [Chryseolinea sp.]
MKRLKFRLIHALLFALITTGASAQNFSGYNWYFGNGPQGVRFSRSDNTATLVNNQATPFGTGGSAVASSQVNGDLLFYTDGANIYDVSRQVMPQGTGLIANPSGNQPVAVAKVPGQDNQFYIFMNDPTGSIFFRTVDMTAFGNAVFPTPALGDATSTTNSPVTGLTGRAPAMIVVPHANGDNFWLITHANGSPDYTVTLFTPLGPTTTTTFTNLGLIDIPANFAYHAASNRIAVSPQEPTRDVEVLTFDPATGALAFQQRILNSAVTAAAGLAIFDTEWSSTGRFLYISRVGQTGVQADVLQFDFSNPATSLATILPQPNSIFRSFGLQMAPDSAIYHLYQPTSGGPFLLGKITDADSVASLVIYSPQAFPGNINFNGTQFPSFTPRDTVIITVAFTSEGLCANAPTGFFPAVTPGADSLQWNFGDGSGSSDWSPVYTYTAGGAFNVSVTAFLNGQTVTATQPVTITDFDTQISLVQDTTACSCELPFPKAPNPPQQCGQFSVKATVNGSGTAQLQWFGPGGLIAGATSETLQPDSAGYYYLVATVGGCSTYAGVNIKEYDVEDQRANIWYFGNLAGLDFNPLPENPVIAITNPVMNAPEGTSTISDRNGQVIFFTDGDKVWNRQNVEIATGIGGEPGSSQAALIMPVPGDETLFYIFTTQEVQGSNTYELRYSLFDLKLNGGTGGLIEQDVLLFARSTERITGSANWLIAHEYGNNSFRAYRISNLGIGNPVISGIGSDHTVTSAENGQGYMKLGAQNRLAVALSTPGTSNVIEIFDFADSTGTVSNLRTANLNNPSGQVYGVEFSPGGNKLFATLKGATSQIVEFAFDSLAIPYLKKPPIAPVTEELGAIQTGPDGQIYVAVNGEQFLGTIQADEDTTRISTFTLNGMALLGGTNSNLGLPNFIQNLADPAQGPSISIAGECIQDSVQFQGTPTDPIDKFFWQVRLGPTVVTTSAEEAFNFLFTTPGLYNVSLRLTNRCGLDTTLTRQHRVNDVPPNPSASVVLCTNEVVLDANPSDLPGLTYVWSTGETTETITVNRQAIYRVSVSNAAGCSTDGRILAADNRPIADLGNDLTVCQNTPIAPLDADNPGATYAWTINGVPSGTGRTQRVNTSLPSPPTFEYEVIITDPVTTCFLKDSVIFTINPIPVITPPVTTNPTTCGANDGTINLSITGPANALFSYFITGPSTSVSDFDRTAGPIPPALGLGAGTYGITVTDQVSGCAVTTTAAVNDGAFTVAGSTNDTCDPMNIDVVLTQVTGTVTFPFTYRVLDVALPASPTETGSGGSLNFSTAATGLPSDGRQYVIEVTSNGCVASSPNILIDQDPTVPTMLTSDVCVNPITITSSGGATFLWTGPSIVAGTESQATVSATPAAGTHTYNLTVTDVGFCALDTAITVTVQPPITAAIAQGSACADQVLVTATPNGNFLYRWFRNGVLDQSIAGPQVTANSANDGQQYSVTLYSPVTGCTSSSPAITVQVDGQLEVEVTTTTPCEGSPFTLTAVPSRASTFQWALDGSVIAGQTAATLQEERSGTYTVTATASTCSTTAEIEIFLAPATPGLLNEEVFICPDPANPDPNTREVVLRPGEFESYDWLKDGVNLGIATPTFTAGEAGLYSVNLINSFGCPSSDKTNVLIQCDPVIVGPNAFRPSSGVVGLEGDFVNQSFRLFTFFIDDEGFEVFIFNRWGEMIFHSPERDFKWNGAYNNAGPLVPAGTYTYVVRYKSSYRKGLGIQEKRGGVVLLR